jgi:hypothetical protein
MTKVSFLEEALSFIYLSMEAISLASAFSLFSPKTANDGKTTASTRETIKRATISSSKENPFLKL